MLRDPARRLSTPQGSLRFHCFEAPLQAEVLVMSYTQPLYHEVLNKTHHIPSECPIPLGSQPLPLAASPADLHFLPAGCSWLAAQDAMQLCQGRCLGHCPPCSLASTGARGACVEGPLDRQTAPRQQAGPGVPGGRHGAGVPASLFVPAVPRLQVSPRPTEAVVQLQVEVPVAVPAWLNYTLWVYRNQTQGCTNLGNRTTLVSAGWALGPPWAAVAQRLRQGAAGSWTPMFQAQLFHQHSPGVPCPWGCAARRGQGWLGPVCQ